MIVLGHPRMSHVLIDVTGELMMLTMAFRPRPKRGKYWRMGDMTK
jgi:hypothetical protein